MHRCCSLCTCHRRVVLCMRVFLHHFPCEGVPCLEALGAVGSDPGSSVRLCGAVWGCAGLSGSGEPLSPSSPARAMSFPLRLWCTQLRLDPGR